MRRGRGAGHGPGCARRASRVCSSHSTRPSPTAWAWAYLSAARLSKPMVGGCGRPGASRGVLSFTVPADRAAIRDRCRYWQIVLKSPFGVTTKVFRTADAFARGDMRDHIVSHKNDHGAFARFSASFNFRLLQQTSIDISEKPENAFNINSFRVVLRCCFGGCPVETYAADIHRARALHRKHRRASGCGCNLPFCEH